MKRLAFISALLGIGTARAQDLKAHERMQSFMARAGRRQVKPANGECPVCGTMAEPFKPGKVMAWRDNCQPQPPTSLVGCMGVGWVDATPTSRTVTCAHCRVLFQQEAEGDGSH